MFCFKLFKVIFKSDCLDAGLYWGSHGKFFLTYFKLGEMKKAFPNY